MGIAFEWGKTYTKQNNDKGCEAEVYFTQNE